MAQGLGSSTRSIRLLSFDGGGVRGLGSLLFLKELMEVVNDDKDTSTSTPYPCQYFDMIVGTGTGGLIAIMLGRLRMGIDECIEAYLEIGRGLFANEGFPWLSKLTPRVRVEQKEETIQNILKGLLQPLNSPLDEDIFTSSPHSCKCVVVAIHDQRGCRKPYLFRSYDHPGSRPCNPYERNPGVGAAIPIWQVARATSSASDTLPPTKIWDKSFFDKGPAFKNPALDAFLEAQQLCGNEAGAVALTISVGTGKERSRLRRTLKRPCGQKIIDKRIIQSEETDETLKELCRGKSAQYYRFDIDTLDIINLDDWGSGRSDHCRTVHGTTKRIYKLTDQYLTRPEIQKEIKAAAEALFDNDYPEKVCDTSRRNSISRGDTEPIRETSKRINSYVETLLVTNSPIDKIVK